MKNDLIVPNYTYINFYRYLQSRHLPVKSHMQIPSHHRFHESNDTDPTGEKPGLYEESHALPLGPLGRSHVQVRVMPLREPQQRQRQETRPHPQEQRGTGHVPV